MKEYLLGIFRALLITLAAVILPVCAFARDIELPLDGTPVTGTVVDFSQDADKFNFKVDALTRVTVEMKGYSYDRDLAFDGLIGNYLQNDRETDYGRSYTIDVYPGRYSLSVYSHYADYGPCTLRATGEKLQVAQDPEPNDDRENAIDMAFDVDYAGYTPIRDVDYYRLVIGEDSDIAFDVLNIENAREYCLRGENDERIQLMYAGTNGDRLRYKATVRKGTYYFVVQTSDLSFGITGGYKAKASVIGPSSAAYFFNGLYENVLAGYDGIVYVGVNPDGYGLTNVVWSSSKPNVLSIEPNGETCRISALNKGTAILKAEFDDGYISAKIKVSANGYSRSKPLSGRVRGLYTSHKRLYYKDGYLCGEAYITNKTKSVIRQLPGVIAGVYDAENLMWEFKVDIGTWKPKTPLRPGKSAVIKFSAPQSRVGLLQLNIFKKRYQAMAGFSFEAFTTPLQKIVK